MASSKGSSGARALPRPRFSRARRVAVVAASASVLTGAAMALPAATIADTSADPPPIVSLGVAGTEVEVPDVGVPLPPVEIDTDDIPVVAAATGVLGLSAAIDTAPADTVPGSDEPTAPAPNAPQPAAPQPAAPSAPQPAAPQPAAPQPSAPQPVTTDSDQPAPALSGGAPTGVQTRVPVDARRSVPTSAIAGGAPAGRAVAATPSAEQAPVKGVLTIGAQTVTVPSVVDQAAAVRAAQVLAAEKAESPSKGGLGLVAPLSDLGSGKVDSLNLASGSGPAASSGDWNLLPEALYAVVPLLMAGAAVAANQRRTAATAATIGVIQRRRHASR